MKAYRSSSLWLLSVWVVAWTGCASTAGQQLDRRASHSGLDLLAFEGGDFLLRAYRQDPGTAGTVWNLYLEGDGRPWIGGRYVAADPHGRNNIAFDLMGRDSTPSIYFQRPCYLRLRPGEPCDPYLWSHGRYSETVVGSLEKAIQRWIRQQGVTELVLIGYSGGGALARLLAPRIPEVSTLVTVAANLDTDRWAEIHGFEPLEGSLNPAHEPPLPPEITQIHFFGELDPNVPAESMQSALAGEPDARVETVPGFDHRCCWVERWPELLGQIR